VEATSALRREALLAWPGTWWWVHGLWGHVWWLKAAWSRVLELGGWGGD